MVTFNANQKMNTTTTTTCVPPSDLQLGCRFRISKNWAQKNGVNLNEIKHQLVVVDHDKKHTDALYEEDKVFLWVPRYFGLTKWSQYLTKDAVLFTLGQSIPSDRARFDATLKESRQRQESSVKACMEWFRKAYGCILRMPCGMGKTVTSLCLVAQFQRKTLYLVQAETLFDQTIASIQKFMPQARIGQMRGPVESWIVDDCDIVVGMFQTLYRHKLALKSELTTQFGFIVADECHHVGAPMFYAVLQRFRPMRFLGLSATPTRADKKTKWPEMLLGPIVDVFDADELRRPDIHVFWSQSLPTSFPDDHFARTMQIRKQNDNIVLTTLVMWDTKRRMAQIKHLLQRVLLPLLWVNPCEPQIVVFADRIFHLCLLSYVLQRQYMFHRLQQRNPQLAKGVCQVLMKFMFYHAEMEEQVATDPISNVHTVADYYRAGLDRGKHAQSIKDCQTSYIKYANSFECVDSTSSRENNLMFPMRFLLGQPKTKSNAQELNRTVLFATMRKLGEGVDITSLHTVCLMSSLSASNKGQLEQVIGRLRYADGQKRFIYEFRDDDIQVYRRRMFARRKYYDSRGMPQYYF